MRLGIALFPDRRFLSLARRVVEEEADVFEVSPEMLWRDARAPATGREPLVDLVRRAGRPVLAHGLALSLGSAQVEPDEPDELERLARDRADLGFSRWSEHLGVSSHDGLKTGLALPLLTAPETVAAVAGRLRRVQARLGVPVAVEPVTSYFHLGDPRRGPGLVNSVVEAADCGLLLDLHNLWADEKNGGLALAEWLSALDLSRVVEVHLAGGDWSDPAWLASGRRFWLDSHDAPVPGPVWDALEWVLPRCPRLDAVVLERVPDALDEARLPAWEAEVRRARRVVCSGT